MKIHPLRIGRTKVPFGQFYGGLHGFSLSEFAAGDTYGSMFGVTRNPYDLERTAGGSSAGSGAAVVSLAGKTHVSRVGVSLLTNVGLPELVAQNADDYIRIAIKLARDVPRLREMQLTEKADAKPLTLSGGMQQRLMIARALMHDPNAYLHAEAAAVAPFTARRALS